MMDDTNISQSTALRTDYYVYLFRNPIDKNIFYIGKGTGPRAENLNNRNPKTKAVIEEIRKTRKEPITDIIEILRDNLDEDTAKKLEGAAIDLIGIPPLTNLNHGQGTKKWKGKPNKTNLNEMKTEELDKFIDPDEADITEHAILIRINQLYQYGMDADSLYDATRGVWVIGGREAGGRRDCAKYAFSVFKGVIMEVYKIKQWYLAGTGATFYKTRPNANKPWTYEPPRWEFEGDIAESEIRNKYLNKSVKRLLSANSQNPIKYVNC
jgi:hypothetical protein